MATVDEAEVAVIDPVARDLILRVLDQSDPDVRDVQRASHSAALARQLAGSALESARVERRVRLPRGTQSEMIALDDRIRRLEVEVERWQAAHDRLHELRRRAEELYRAAEARRRAEDLPALLEAARRTRAAAHGAMQQLEAVESQVKSAGVKLDPGLAAEILEFLTAQSSGGKMFTQQRLT